MHADHADDLASIRDQAQRLLLDLTTPEHLKSLLNEPGSFDRTLWDHAVEQGWTTTAVPERFGGLGLGWGGLAVLSEELGQVTGSLPLMANTLAINALLAAGMAQDDAHLQGLVEGSRIACLALATPEESGLSGNSTVRESQGRLSGYSAATPFAAIADVALVRAGRDLYLVPLDQKGIERRVGDTFDNARATAVLRFDEVQAQRLGDANLVAELGSLAALITAFEQIGGTQACLNMACDYARERRAFGQVIGGFQGIKHKLAEIYCLLEIARGCATDALDAWEQNLPDRQLLTCAARIAATRAYDLAAQENLHVHGGMGVTWEAMPHHHYRRSRSLALELGGLPYWRERLLAGLGIESATALAG